MKSIKELRNELNEESVQEAKSNHIDYTLSTPIDGIQEIDAEKFIKELKSLIKYAKQESDHFNWKHKRFTLAMNDSGPQSGLVLRASKR